MWPLCLLKKRPVFDLARVQIRWQIRADLPAVLAIENAVFGVPWTEDEFLAVLRERNAIGRVAECDGRIVGYCVILLHRSCIEILNMGVAPQLHRQRIGTAMLAKLESRLTPVRSSLIATVGENNLAAQLFFKANSFRCEQIQRGYYEPISSEAGYQFRYTLEWLP